MTDFPQTIECLVIGGGLAGAMAALRLAQAARQVLLVEREPHARPKVCGEFLSAEALAYLRACDIEPAELGAQLIQKVRFAHARKVVEAQLPFRAMSLSREVLDQQMLQRAEQHGCRIVRGTTIDALTRNGGVWQAHTANGQRIQAHHLFLATGKHDLRGWTRPAGVQNDLVGLKMRWHLAADQHHALAGGIELLLFAGGYAGLVQMEDGSANLAIAVRKSALRQTGGWPGLLARMRAQSRLLHERLTGAQPLWERPLAVSAMPYGYVARANDGCWRVGDQVAVIPSFTGDGMAIALHSGALAAEMLLAGRSPADYQQLLAAHLRPGMKIATALSRLMASPAAALIAPAATALLPMVLGWIARSTRIPARALRTQASGA